ncbi:helix-turn-helix domain-containing protein [bacterium 1XD42-1]|nr:helix-turn-helix domain-containing protein [bacterium 1XD42-8]RKJ61882.1 helix-turn-helix domain-containing protein [bacterium 1XD42-1]
MLNRQAYIYPNIVYLMTMNGDTLKSLSKELGMGYQALSARMKGTKAFELPEIYKLMNKYNSTFEHLFSLTAS